MVWHARLWLRIKHSIKLSSNYCTIRIWIPGNFSDQAIDLTVNDL